MARRSAAEWQELVDGWASSGLDRHVYARRAGVHPDTLGWWRWRLASGPQASFAEVVVASDPPPPPPDFVLEVGSVRVRVAPGFDGPELRRLVTALC